MGQLRRRSYPAELAPAIHTRPFREVVRLFAPQLGFPGLVRHETGRFSIDAVYRGLDRAVARRLQQVPFSAVYAYEDGAEFSFREARRRGVGTLYDLPIGYWRAARALLLEEAERQPEWAVTLAGNRDSAAKTERKDAELALAEVVFVASSYTRRTLSEASDFKGTVVVVPYGAPALPAVAPSSPPLPAKQLRVLFVGSLGQRKGLSYLFAACRQVQSAVTLTVIGQKPQEPCPALDRELAGARWIASCPHSQILAEMAAHDVFVFPSLFEGFGLVLLEALAAGLPIITTPHTAGPDLIQEGVDGFIVPIRDSTAIAERLELLHRDPARRAEMSRQARRRAREFTWASYEATLAACVRQALARNFDTRTMKSSIKFLIWLYIFLLLVEETPFASGLSRRYPTLCWWCATRWRCSPSTFSPSPKEFSQPTASWWPRPSPLARSASVAASLLGGHTNLLVLGYGLRINYLHLPLIWIMGRVLTRRDVEHLGAFLLLMAIPMTLVMVVQFRAPVDAFINRGVGNDEVGQIYGADGRIRPPGLFSFITGPQLYYPLCAAFFFDEIGGAKRLPWYLLIATGLAITVALPVSISRTAMLGTVLVAGVFVCALPFSSARFSALGRPILLLALLAAALSQFAVFREGTSVFMTRWDSAADDEGAGSAWSSVMGRTVNGFKNPYYFMQTAPFLGYGIGTGSNVGARLTSGNVGFTLAEEEWGKVLLEARARDWGSLHCLSHRPRRLAGLAGLARPSAESQRAANPDFCRHRVDLAARAVGSAHGPRLHGGRRRIVARRPQPGRRGGGGRGRSSSAGRRRPGGARHSGPCARSCSLRAEASLRAPHRAKMKVLLIGNLAEDRQESMQRFTDLLQSGLQARGHTVTVIAPTLRLARFGPAYRYGGLPKYLGYFDKFVLFPRQLRRHIRSTRPDVVHIADHANAMYASAVASVPVLVTCHDLLQLRAALGEIPQQPLGRVGRIYQAWIRASLGRVPLIACVSNRTRADVLRLIQRPPERSTVVPIALNFSYQPVPAATARVQLEDLVRRFRLGPAFLDPAKGGFLIHVGGGQWYKNRDGLLAIYAHLRQLISPVPQLILVGPPMDAARGGASSPNAQREGVVFLQGVTNVELASLYSLAQGLIFPSWEEGFGWPVAEAQACGCPVFASNRAPMNEVGGCSSFYFDPENPADAARTIAAAWPERHARRALALEESRRWQPGLMLEAYEAIYREIPP